LSIFSDFFHGCLLEALRCNKCKLRQRTTKENVFEMIENWNVEEEISDY